MSDRDHLGTGTRNLVRYINYIYVKKFVARPLFFCTSCLCVFFELRGDVENDRTDLAQILVCWLGAPKVHKRSLSSPASRFESM